ncbi:MAG: DUF808 domain-containing protein [Chitinophagales bacterium]|jgi:hypothetical protein|nr:DUF808 domain-containing protein [Chitinophagales bacterium]
MASGFFAILDDIAALMDDVVVMSKLATKKTSGILGDDLAVNAEKSTGFVSSRELPILGKIALGSFINKLIIIPLVFILSALYKPAVIAFLIFGALFLAYEAVLKIKEFLDFLINKKTTQKNIAVDDLTTPNIDESKEIENSKVKSAIITDFILSLEIIIIALSTVLDETLLEQILVVSVVGIIATIGVYGIVALIVRLDDMGLFLIQRSKNKGFLASIGHGMVWLLPQIIKALSFIGVIALLMVAGEILVHYIPWIHQYSDRFLHALPEILRFMFVAFVVGLLVFGLIKPISILVKKLK